VRLFGFQGRRRARREAEAAGREAERFGIADFDARYGRRDGLYLLADRDGERDRRRSAETLRAERRRQPRARSAGELVARRSRRRVRRERSTGAGEERQADERGAPAQ